MKKRVYRIEYRYDKGSPWIEYANTSVPGMVNNYVKGASLENPGAEVRIAPERK